VSVNVGYSNVSPETIETTVTGPIENAVSRVSGIDILESNSFEGLSTVRVQFEFGTDINVAAVASLEHTAVYGMILAVRWSLQIATQRSVNDDEPSPVSAFRCVD